MLLDAKVGEPKADPKLVPLPCVQRPFRSIVLGINEMKDLCAKPSDPDSPRLVFDEDGGMLLDEMMGRFSVIPLEGSRFLLDDVYREIFIEKNAGGTVKRVITERSLGQKAQECLNAGRNDEAIEHLQKALESYPRSAELFELLAGAFEQKGDLTRAIETWRRLLAVDPQNVHAAAMIERLEIRMNPVVVPAETLAGYAGTYGKTTIILENGTLYAQREGDAKRFELVPKAEDYFLIDGVDYPRLRFIKGENGAVEAMELIVGKEQAIRLDRAS